MEGHREQTQSASFQSSGSALSVATPDAMPAATNIKRFIQSIWQAPLVPVALAVAAGIVVDRKIEIPAPDSLTDSLGSHPQWKNIESKRKV
jgi:hypothetical protein